MTSETREKATAGPWQFVAGNIYSDKDGAMHRRICAIAFYGDEDKEAQANTKLIVAAPALRDALAATARQLEAACSDFAALAEVAEASFRTPAIGSQQGNTLAKLAAVNCERSARAARELLASLEGAL